MMGSASYAVAQWFVAVRGALMELVRGALAADNQNVVLLEYSTLTPPLAGVFHSNSPTQLTDTSL